MFTWRHFLWLGICAAVTVFLTVAYEKKKPPITKVLNSALVVCALSEFTKVFSVIELVPSANGEQMLPYLPLNHLPLHFCSIQILVILFARFTKDEGKKQSALALISAAGIIGGIAALLMPSIFSTSISVEQAFTSPISYQFFVFHTMLIVLGIIIIRSHAVAWEKKHFVQTLCCVYAMAVASVYLNSVFASPTYEDGRLVRVDFWTNFFFTYQNPLGIRLTALWQWYVYLVVLVAVTALLTFIFYYPLVFHERKNKGSGSRQA